MTEVDRLGNGVVGVFLESRLHTGMIQGGHIVGAHKDPTDIGGNLVDMGDGALLGNALHQFLGIQAAGLQGLQQNGIDLHQTGVVHHVADVGISEDGLHAGRAAADHGDGTGGGDGGDGAVAERCLVLIDGLAEQREAAADGSQFPAGVVTALVDEAHQMFRQIHALVGIVGDAQIEQHIGKAHNAQTDLTGGTGDLSNFFQRIVIDVDDVIQEVHRQRDGVAQLLIVDLPAKLGLFQHLDQVDRAQIAALIGQQGLLAAGVGGFDLALRRHHVVPVQTIQEDDARLAVGPCSLYDLVKQLAGRTLAARLLGSGIDEIIILILFHRLHKGFGKANGDIEVGNVGIILFAADELLDIGMIHPQDAHISATAGAALLDGFGSHVEHTHKADRARGHTAGGADGGTCLPQAAEGKAGAAARLMDESGILHRIKDVHHAVIDGQHEAGAQLTQRTAGIH